MVLLPQQNVWMPANQRDKKMKKNHGGKNMCKRWKHKTNPKRFPQYSAKFVYIFLGTLTSFPSCNSKKLVQAHGGSICHHFSAKSTTHVVCTNLCASKSDRMLQKIRCASKLIHIINPDWVIQSTQQKKRLKEHPFRITLPNSVKSKDLSNFFLQRQ